MFPKLSPPRLLACTVAFHPLPGEAIAPPPLGSETSDLLRGALPGNGGQQAWPTWTCGYVTRPGPEARPHPPPRPSV